MLAGTAGPALADGASPATTTPGQLCQTSNGSFLDLGQIANACLLPTAATEADIQHAEALCAQEGGHLFVAVGNVAYACVLPSGSSILTGPPGTGGTGTGVVTSPTGLGLLSFLNNLLGNGGSGNGLPGNGLPGNGLPGNGLLGTGLLGNGLLGNGLLGGTGLLGSGGAGNATSAGPGILRLFPIQVS